MAYTTINKSTDYFNTKLYTGTGATHSITGVGFQPDWVWIKARNYNDNHRIVDAVRGVTKDIYSDLTLAEGTNTNGLTAFGSDGFTLGSDGGYNSNTDNYASWNWKANGAGVSNTDGSITSTVSANTTAGFSIVSYTGTNATGTVGHGLGTTPKIVLYKNRTDSTYWYFTTSLIDGTHDLLLLPATDAQQPFSAPLPTSSVLNLIGNNDTNGSGDNIIAYCFTDVTGYSKFGTYNGNNNATDGTFVYTGFKPAFLIVKDTQSGQYWHMFDSKREPFNDDDTAHLSPNNNGSEATIRTDRGVAKLDFLSNGFKWRTDNSGFNGTNKYIYMCFAESPLVGTNGVTAKAR